MDKTKWARIESLFHAALKIEPAKRGLFVEQECEGDDELKQAVESLLKHDKNSADLDQYVAHAAHSLVNSDDDLTGTRIGAYQLTAELGQGGMGTVYLAHRDDDQYRQKVAIKIIRAGSINDEVKRRFRLERQILANLEHPFSARLLDGGATDNGLPYLIMEYVEGQSIDDFCNNNQLSLQDRLALFRKVCSAVFYAHQKLVVHRDLKPSNILVTKDGEPRLLDFGIAKLLENSESSPDMLETREEDRLLTPQYSSPEQIRGEAVSTATDVYALGIVLYELITGKRPYGDKQSSSYEIQKQVLETDPLRPSYSITQSGKNSYISPDTELSDGRFKWCGMIRPKQLKRQLSGDLDNIVMMALRKEPEQRYASVSQLSKDIEYYLQNRPVIARPLSWLYRTTRLVQRNLLSSSVSTLLLLSVTGFTAATLIQSKQVDAERKKAVAIVSFLTDMFSEIEPDKAQGKKYRCGRCWIKRVNSWMIKITLWQTSQWLKLQFDG
ncbi:MAG: protein kinase [Gammaproteobacteria bacterium]|nr:protein kinase [Gammaproteobacteria bacterium]